MGNAPSSRSAASSVEAVIMMVAPSGRDCVAEAGPLAGGRRGYRVPAGHVRIVVRVRDGLRGSHGPVVDRLDGERVAGPHAPHGIQRAVQVVESDAMDAVRYVMRQTAGHGDEPTAARASLKPLEQGPGAFAAVSAGDDQIRHAFRLCRPDTWRGTWIRERN